MMHIIIYIIAHDILCKVNVCMYIHDCVCVSGA